MHISHTVLRIKHKPLIGFPHFYVNTSIHVYEYIYLVSKRTCCLVYCEF